MKSSITLFTILKGPEPGAIPGRMTMNVQDAVNLINKTTFRPGWTITARNDYGWGYRAGNGKILVEFAVRTVDTSYVDDDGQYTRKMTQRGVAEFGVAHLDGLGLLRGLLDWVHASYDEHEDREFLRVKQDDGSWLAPFHPHRSDGDRAWARADHPRLERSGE
jgi:hypothetical protein